MDQEIILTVPLELDQSASVEVFSALVDRGNIQLEVTETDQSVEATVFLTSTPDIIRDNPYIVTVRTMLTTQNRGPIQSDVNYLMYTRDIEDIDPNTDTEPPMMVTSLSPLEENQISLFPNPAKDKLELTINENTINQVYVTNIEGKVESRQFLLSGRDLKLDISDLNTGIYFLTLEYGNGSTERLKFIKQ